MRICGTTRVAVGLLLLTGSQAEAAADFYLIAPPASQPSQASGSDMNLSAPLRQWERRGSFDTSAACFAALNAYRAETSSRLEGSSLGPEARSSTAALEHARATFARCVYANDPRLR
jgi:hypothetical protein